MTRRAYLYFLLTFILGAIVGWAGTYTFGWYSGRWHHRYSRQHVVEYLHKQLSLSDAQTDQLKQIMNDMAKKDAALREQLEPQFQAIREESRNRVRQILNSQQLTKFNAMVERWDARSKQRGHAVH